MKPILVGAVIYDPKVSIIWDIIRSFFAAEGCPIDCVYYTNYELQVAALVSGHVDIAWNSPLAWVDAQARTGGRCRAIAMRDTDRDRTSHIVVRSNDGVRAAADLRGRTLATGAVDSPQATLLPMSTCGARAWWRDAITTCGVTICWSASMAITSAASGKRCDRWRTARPTPRRCWI